jgi:hypothetical protein
MCDEVAALGCPLHVECWTSSLLGRLWERRVNLQPTWDSVDWALARGGPIVKDIAAHGGRGAKLILSAVQRLDPAGLGVLCGELAERLPDDLLPEWAGQIGSARVVRATSACSALDEEVMFLEAGGERLRGAIMRTDASYALPVGETFADLRALALSRARSLL